MSCEDVKSSSSLNPKTTEDVNTLAAARLLTRMTTNMKIKHSSDETEERLNNIKLWTQQAQSHHVTLLEGKEATSTLSAGVLAQQIHKLLTDAPAPTSAAGVKLQRLKLDEFDDHVCQAISAYNANDAFATVTQLAKAKDAAIIVLLVTHAE